MHNLVRSFVVAAAFVQLGSVAVAVELIRFEAPCAVGDSRAAKLRQTVIVVDESLLAVGPNAVQDNQRWSRPLLEIADGLPSGQRGTMNPGERLSIFFARQNGSELSPVFFGCSPNLSAEQRQKMESESSVMRDFITGGATKRIAGARRDYENALIRSFGIMARAKQDEKSAPEAGALLRAMTSAPRFIDLSAGIPRIVLFSPFAISEKSSWSSQREAREAGFDLAARMGIDFQRAEVHVVGVQASSPHLRAFAEAFLLRSRGLLAGWRSDGIPQLLSSPSAVSVFGGNVQMDAVLAPVQVRLSVDAQGNLVNSWIEVTTGRSLATPITGKAICKSADSCDVKGDGRLMGQAWNPEPGERPVFNALFAWSGLRYFEMSFNGTSGTVRIWDPSAKIQMGDRQLEDFRFAVQRTDNQQF